MKDYHTPKAGSAEFFMSANSGSGFRTYQAEILDSKKLDCLYILKGGPGTGKSTFMKKVLDVARASGADARIFKCSSDPDSIDAVYITSEKCRIAITDGTAPHERNAELPGAIDRIIDLGQFWNEEIITRSKDEILNLNAKKKESYKWGYKYLEAAKKTQEILCGIYEKSLLDDKLRRSATSFLRNIANLGEAKNECFLLSAYSMSGYRRLNTDISDSETLIAISGSDEECSIYLRAVFNILKTKTQCIRIENPLSPDVFDGIILPLHSISFVEEKFIDPLSNDKIAKKINARRFFDATSIKRSLREIKESRVILKKQVEFALDHFAEAGRFHFELEKIYRSAMDFARENEFSNTFCKRLAERLS